MLEFKLPSLGADMDEGRLLEWKVQPGDAVRKGQVVAVVDTSKAAVDVEIWQEGTIHELRVPPGEMIPVGTVLATLLPPGEAAPGPAPEPAETPRPAGRVKISPAARRRAQELGVDLATLTPRGPDGTLTLADVERAAPRVTPEVAPVAPAAPQTPAERVAETRKAIAAAMGRSKREIPHYYLLETIPLGAALAWLEATNARRPITARLLLAALQIKAVARALAKFPDLNGFYRNERFEPAAAINPGVAISLRQGGLIAPALQNADQKPLDVLMGELADLVKRTRAGSLRSSEMSQATVTITNLGDQGVEAVLGVIYPPQVALVGFGKVTQRPWVDQGQLGVMPTVTASLAADHRVSDGHRGALFLAELGALLQHPQDL
ncbi:MAG: dihydrolipoamide acetyltransferase family protein [Rhodocyclaceae bacterium]|jgi:pyruvate dehydrogenase E2 component (dihydrolipoamide acetyltransferase)|nr:dihydrolipoamide acetyltransferase family protein [Rhodocyclaceae bacterium]